ncbi:MAG: tetratricopeptide repeat protein [Bacteroidetes bacterium]|nr:tetratricopeptide repeat protein [Bacteroidota bacterium]
MAKTNRKDRTKKKQSQTKDSGGENFQWRNAIILTAIAIYILVLFSPAIKYDFTNWDDPDYIISNELIRDFSLEGMAKIFTTPVIGMYNPLPFAVYSFVYHFWELNPQAYHLLSIILHILATIMLYKFIFRLTGRYEVATIVAILFAIHPMHVSVVTWACQIKTSLFLIFFFYGQSLYLDYIHNNYRIKFLVYAALLFILACLSKPSAVTFAPILFLVDYYLSRKIDKRLFLEKIPFFLIALGFGILTLMTHSDEGDSIFEVGQNYSLFDNFLVSNYSIVFYFEKFIYPRELSTIYGYPDSSTTLPLKYFLAIPVIPLIIWGVYRAGKFRKELIFGTLFFIIAISVLLRIVPSGFFGTANRYTYLSYTGLFFIMGQFYVYVKDDKFSYAGKIKNYVIGAMLAFIVFCTWRTTIRIKVWENSITLFNDVIDKQPNVAVAYNQRAIAKNSIGDNVGALEDLTKAIELDPKYAAAYNNRGSLRDLLKNYEPALEDFNKAIEIEPDYFDAYSNRGAAKFHLDRIADALADYDSSIQINDGRGLTFFNRAVAKISLADTLGAVADWRRAIELGVDQARQYLILYDKKQDMEVDEM